MNVVRGLSLLVLVGMAVGCVVEADDEGVLSEGVVEGSMGDEKGDGSQELSVQRDWSGYLGAPRNVSKVDRRTITTASSFERIFGEEPPAWLDFDRTWLIVYVAGDQQTNGYRAEVSRVRLSRTGSSIEVETRLVVPEAACVVREKTTHPYQIVGIPNPGTRPQSVRYYAANADPSCSESACAAQVLSELDTASKSLIYTSESDHPFQPRLFAGAGDALADDASILEAIGEPAGEVVERRSFVEWISSRTVTEEDDAYARRVADGYSRLRDTMKAELTEVEVVRVGEIEVRIYLLGRTACGDLAGVSTVSIET